MVFNTNTSQVISFYKNPNIKHHVTRICYNLYLHNRDI